MLQNSPDFEKPEIRGTQLSSLGLAGGLGLRGGSGPAVSSDLAGASALVGGTRRWRRPADFRLFQRRRLGVFWFRARKRRLADGRFLALLGQSLLQRGARLALFHNLSGGNRFEQLVFGIQIGPVPAAFPANEIVFLYFAVQRGAFQPHRVIGRRVAELALTVFCRPFLHEPLQLLLGMLRDFFNSGGNGGRFFFGESGFENLAQISILVPFSAFGHAKKGLFGADCPVETVLDLHLSEKHHVHCVQGERRFEPGAALGQSLRQIFLQIIDMVLVLDHRILQFKDLPADFLFPGFSYQAAVKDAAAGLGFDNVDAALIDGKDVDFIKISVFLGTTTLLNTRPKTWLLAKLCSAAIVAIYSP